MPLRPTPRDLLDRGRPSLFSAPPWQERLAKLETELEAMKLKLAEAGPETRRFQLVNGHECDLPARFQLLSHPASLDFRWVFNGFQAVSFNARLSPDAGREDCQEDIGLES